MPTDMAVDAAEWPCNAAARRCTLDALAPAQALRSPPLPTWPPQPPWNRPGITSPAADEGMNPKPLDAAPKGMPVDSIWAMYALLAAAIISCDIMEGRGCSRNDMPWEVGAVVAAPAALSAPAAVAVAAVLVRGANSCAAGSWLWAACCAGATPVAASVAASVAATAGEGAEASPGDSSTVAADRWELAERLADRS